MAHMSREAIARVGDAHLAKVRDGLFARADMAEELGVKSDVVFYTRMWMGLLYIQDGEQHAREGAMGNWESERTGHVTNEYEACLTWLYG